MKNKNRISIAIVIFVFVILLTWLINAESLNYYNVNFDYSNDKLKIDSIELETNNFLPKFLNERTEGANQYSINILDNQDKVLNVVYFYFSNILYYDTVDDFEAETPKINGGGSIELTETSSSVKIPYYENAKLTALYDPSGKEIDKWDLLTNTRYVQGNPAASGSSSGSGEGGFIPKIISIKSDDITKGITKTINAEQILKIQIPSGTIIGATEPHTVKTALINKNQVKIIVSSEPQEKILSIGEEWKVDVNEDENYELLIKLERIENNQPVLSMKAINETSNSTETIENPEIVKNNQNQEKETSNSLQQIIMPFFILVIIICIILFVWKPWKNR